MTIAVVTDVGATGRRPVARADLSVPMDPGRVTDATRIARLAKGAKTLGEVRAAAWTILGNKPRGAFAMAPLDTGTVAFARVADSLLPAGAQPLGRGRGRCHRGTERRRGRRADHLCLHRLWGIAGMAGAARASRRGDAQARQTSGSRRNSPWH